ncbi:DAK2 domain-containing protein [Streptomyces sp. NPDC127033]|uniref:DAK2 domain-containing protein n=1 Tax=Streptomyces sp. NPDC127033 TaxID=3347110 RepID=UPI003657758A
MSALAAKFRDHVGGTSGPLFGLFFDQLSRALGNETTADIPALAAASTNALATISRIGGAQIGDSPLLDALAPAADTLTAADGERTAALTAAARAALNGAATTADLRSRAHPGLGVEVLVTVGSPLGVPGAVFDMLDPAPDTSGNGTRPPGIRHWANIAEAGDLVALPRRLGDRFPSTHTMKPTCRPLTFTPSTPTSPAA